MQKLILNHINSIVKNFKKNPIYISKPYNPKYNYPYTFTAFLLVI